MAVNGRNAAMAVLEDGRGRRPVQPDGQ
jgi:hypothetical protein